MIVHTVYRDEQTFVASIEVKLPPPNG